jgi:hypothetical protein
MARASVHTERYAVPERVYSADLGDADLSLDQG